MSDCGCTTTPDPDSPTTLAAQLTALINTLFGASTITVVDGRPVYQNCFTEGELAVPGGILCSLKDLFNSATGATTDSVSLIQYACLPTELTAPSETVEIYATVIGLPSVPIPFPAGTSSFSFMDGDGVLIADPTTLGLAVGVATNDTFTFPSGTVITDITGAVVTLSQPSLVSIGEGGEANQIAFIKVVPASCSLGDWICWVSTKLTGLEEWKTETRSSLQGFVLQQVADATAAHSAAIYALQVAATSLASSNALLQSQVSGLQTAYNALLARVEALEVLTSGHTTTLSGKADAATVASLAAEVASLTAEVASRLKTPSYYTGVYWTTGVAGVGASQLVADSNWHTIDLRKGYNNLTSTGIGTGLPKYALLGVSTLAAQGDVKVSFSQASGPEADLFVPLVTYALGSHSASAKVTIPVLVPLSGAADPAPVLFKYKIEPGSSAHYETDITLLATF